MNSASHSAAGWPTKADVGMPAAAVSSSTAASWVVGTTLLLGGAAVSVVVCGFLLAHSLFATVGLLSGAELRWPSSGLLLLLPFGTCCAALVGCIVGPVSRQPAGVWGAFAAQAVWVGIITGLLLA